MDLILGNLRQSHCDTSSSKPENKMPNMNRFIQLVVIVNGVGD